MSWNSLDTKVQFFLIPPSLQGWLQRYGYLPRTEPGMSVMRSAQTMHLAIAAMQRVYGLNVTGTLDEKTKEWVYTCALYSWGAHELVLGRRCHINANAPLVH